MGIKLKDIKKNPNNETDPVENIACNQREEQDPPAGLQATRSQPQVGRPRHRHYHAVPWGFGHSQQLPAGPV